MSVHPMYAAATEALDQDAGWFPFRKPFKGGGTTWLLFDTNGLNYGYWIYYWSYRA